MYESIFCKDRRCKKTALRWIFFALLLIADRAVKLLATFYLPETTAQENARFFSLSLQNNQGISFSLLSGFPLVSLVMSILGIAILGFLYLKNAWLRTSVGIMFLWAGAMGNMTDRLLYGYVIDWFYVGVYINLADIWLCVGCLIILRRAAAIF